MKLKYADKRNDNIILKNEFKMQNLNNDFFNGTITLINIKEITNTVSVTRPDNSKDCLIDLDYKWLGIYPKNEKYCITVMYDNNWNLLQWYFDIAKSACKYENNVPYIEDLYLDIVLLPNGNHYMIDEDELAQALSKNLITKSEYNMAYDIANKINNNLEENFEKIQEFTSYCLKALND